MMVLNGTQQQGQFQEITKKENIYFFPKGENDDDLPFLLIHEVDFFMFKNLVHKGAFGQEDQVGSGYKLVNEYNFIYDLENLGDYDMDSKWYFLWKIPGDFNAEEQWNAIQDVNVGKFSIGPDGMKMRTNKQPVPQRMTKWRSDTKAQGPYDPVSTSVHHLQDGDVRIAMISSNMFYKNWDYPTPAESALIKALGKYFYNSHKIRMWNAPMQHAIAFNVTPEEFAKLIADNKVLAEILKAALGPVGKKSGRDDLLAKNSQSRINKTGHERLMFGGSVLTTSAIHTWRENYINKYGN
jgi:hypothetical protein